MPRIEATTGADLNSGETTNIMTLFEGTALLTSKNLFPNNRLKDFRADRTLDQWESLDAALSPTGWNVYDKAPNMQFSGRQNISPLLMTRASYTQNEETLDGPQPPNQGHPSLVADPSKPLLTIVENAVTGFAQGVYGITLAWVVHSLAAPDWRFTGISTRAIVTVTNGQRMQVTLPAEAPEKVLGVAIYSTYPQPNETLAGTADVYLQTVVSATAGRFPSTYELNGPFRFGPVGSTENNTFLGAYQTWPAPILTHEPSPFTLYTINLQASWSFRTDFGWSASQSMIPENNLDHTLRITGGGKEVLAFTPPARPPGAKTWQIEVKGIVAGGDGYWYTYAYKGGDWEGQDFSEKALIWSCDPDDLVKFSNTQYELQRVERRKTDKSGMQTPDIPPPTVSPIGGSIVVAGTHEVITSYSYGDFNEYESGPSERSLVEVPDNLHTWRVFRPPDGNMLPNPEAEEYDIRGTVYGVQNWTETTGAGLDWFFGLGIFQLSDTTGSTADITSIISDPTPIDPTRPHVVRGKLEILSRVGGAVRLILRQVLANATTIDTTLGTQSAVGSQTIERTFGPGGQFALDPTCQYLSLIVQNLGSTNGARSYTWRMTMAGIFQGLIAPRKRTVAYQGYASATENFSDAYPHGGYCVVVADPTDVEKPAALAGVAVNMIEYYGPYGTDNFDAFFARGMKIPVRAAQTFTISFWAQFTGIGDYASLLDSVFRTSSGLIVEHNEPVAHVTADTGWARYTKVFVVPDGAAYLEFHRSSVGQGLVRFIAPQMEIGSSATDYSYSYASTGSLTVTLDTYVPGTVQRLASLNAVRRLNDSGYVADEPEDTTISLYYRSSTTNLPGDYSGWVDDFDDLVFRRYIQIKVDMTTADIDVTPRLKSVYVDVERHEASLLKYNATEFTGGTILKVVEVPAVRRFTEQLEFADNSLGFREIGEPRARFDNFAVEAYSEVTVDEILSSIGREETNGEFVVEIPGIDVEEKGERYRVRFFNARFTPQSARGVSTRVFRADMGVVEVLGKETI